MDLFHLVTIIKKGTFSIIIKSRLLKQLGKSSYYVLWQILLKWTGLIGQIFVIFAAARMLTSGQANSLIKLIAGIVIQVVSLVLYNQASFLASARVKEVLREKSMPSSCAWATITRSPQPN